MSKSSTFLYIFRHLVIGFGFMVPDVKYNEAYISFLFTHPEWRGAGIATFTLYHLIQVNYQLGVYNTPCTCIFWAKLV